MAKTRICIFGAGAIGGYLILDEWLNARQLTGCGLMLLGMILSQLAIAKPTVEEAPDR